MLGQGTQPDDQLWRPAHSKQQARLMACRARKYAKPCRPYKFQQQVPAAIGNS
jgi:hypothetical protein